MCGAGFSCSTHFLSSSGWECVSASPVGQAAVITSPDFHSKTNLGNLPEPVAQHEIDVVLPQGDHRFLRVIVRREGLQEQPVIVAHCDQPV